MSYFAFLRQVRGEHGAQDTSITPFSATFIFPLGDLTRDDLQRRFFCSTQRSNVGTMLQPFETMSQQCWNDVLREKSSLQIVPCNITFNYLVFYPLALCLHFTSTSLFHDFFNGLFYLFITLRFSCHFGKVSELYLFQHIFTLNSSKETNCGIHQNVRAV